ncbi:MAG TPA: sugar phosphate isomerase/epimerase family protein [Bryobacteraceae bacterium]|nr:sugar phosphate isomerase/epimerase family protein [Bryobacteraceae bacterium]
MNHYLSTHVFVNHRLTTALLGRIQQTGVPAVEIFCARQHLDYYNKAQIAELGHWFRDSDLKLHALHSPIHNDEIWGRSGPHAVISLTEPVKSKRIAMVDEIKRALDIAEVAPYRYLIQHMGVSGEEFSLEKVDACFAALEELVIFARQRGVEILLENIPNELSTPERLVQFNELTHLHLNFAFDTGHAHLAGGVADAYRIMKSGIRSTHVHDNDGKVDAHLFPLRGDGGTIDWRAAMALLRSGESQFPLLLELKEKPDIPHPLEAALEVFDKLEAL